jgi:alpha-L-fucosidase 2
MRFQLNLRAVNQGGSIQADTAGIHVKNANEVVLFVSAATSFNGFDKCPDKQGLDEKQLSNSFIDNAAKKSFPVLLSNHLKDFHTYFNRVSLTIKDTLAAIKMLPYHLMSV